jgi:hypothetical protein
LLKRGIFVVVLSLTPLNKLKILGKREREKQGKKERRERESRSLTLTLSTCPND